MIDVCEKAKKIALEREERKHLYNLCLEHMVCPKCGNNLYSDMRLLKHSKSHIEYLVCDSCRFETALRSW